jgi:hypothetical protein
MTNPADESQIFYIDQQRGLPGTSRMPRYNKIQEEEIRESSRIQE